MFNGIIKNTGQITQIKKSNKSMILSIKSSIKIKKNMIGSSISCDGVCLTLISKKKSDIKFLFILWDY